MPHALWLLSPISVSVRPLSTRSSVENDIHKVLTHPYSTPMVPLWILLITKIVITTPFPIHHQLYLVNRFILTPFRPMHSPTFFLEPSLTHVTYGPQSRTWYQLINRSSRWFYINCGLQLCLQVAPYDYFLPTPSYPLMWFYFMLPRLIADFS